MKIRAIPLILLTILFLTFTPAAICAQEVKPQIVGGQFTRLDLGPVALILWQSYRCSGILVGPREVLTAGHCVGDSSANSDYSVIVGGGVYSVESRYYNRSYNPNGIVELNAPYDLGILILSTPVTGTSPIPVLFNDVLTAGESATIYGYGTNEFSGLPGRYPWEDAKTGLMVVTDASGGLLSSIHYLGGASTCHGDSGGPAIQTINGYSVVVGTLTIGINSVIADTCYLNSDGSFSYVDLQSSTSQGFMLNFPGITYISGFRIYVNAVSKDLVTKLKSALKAKSSASLAKKIKPIIRSINQTVPYADGARTTMLKAAAKNLKAAQTARLLSTGLKSARKALKKTQSLSALGVY